MEIHLEFAFEANVKFSETIFIGDTPLGKMKNQRKGLTDHEKQTYH